MPDTETRWHSEPLDDHDPQPVDDLDEPVSSDDGMDDIIVFASDPAEDSPGG